VQTGVNGGSELLIFVRPRPIDHDYSAAQPDFRQSSRAGRQHNVLPERQEFTLAVLVIFRAKGNSRICWLATARRLPMR
jgi:hypothetical protein